MKETTIEPLMTVRETAEFLRLTTGTVRRMSEDGRIPTYRIPRSTDGKRYTVRYRMSDLMKTFHNSAL